MKHALKVSVSMPRLMDRWIRERATAECKAYSEVIQDYIREEMRREKSARG